MKNLTLLVVILFLGIISSSISYSQCTEDGVNCGIWNSGYFVYQDTLNFPGCDILIGYGLKVCNGITYFRLEYIACDGQDADCDAFLYYLLPYGLGNWADGNRLAMIWRAAFAWYANQWINLADPPHKPCPGPPYYWIKTVLPGGCAAVQYATRPYDASHHGQPTIHFKYAKCENSGCCITEIPYCWNGNTWQAQAPVTTQIISSDCTNLQPIENPFSTYGQEWTIYPPGPCKKSCYIDN